MRSQIIGPLHPGLSIAALILMAAVSGAQTSQPATNPLVGSRVITARVRVVDANDRVIAVGSTANEAMAATLGGPIAAARAHYVGDMRLHITDEVKLELLDQRSGGDVTRAVALTDIAPPCTAVVRFAPDDLTPRVVSIRGMDGWGVLQAVDAEKSEVSVHNNHGIEVLSVLPDAKITRAQTDVSAAAQPIALRDLKPMTSLHFTYSALEKGKVTLVAETALDLKQALVKSVDAANRKITLEFKLIDETSTRTFSVAAGAPIGSFDIKTPAPALDQLTGRRVEAQLHPGDPTMVDELNIDIPLPDSMQPHGPATRPGHRMVRLPTQPLPEAATVPAESAPPPPTSAPAVTPLPAPLPPAHPAQPTPVEIPGVN